MADQRRVWTPAALARYDQAIAQAETRLQALAQAFREQCARAGEQQAVSGLIAAICGRPDSQVAWILMAAIRHIANEGRPDYNYGMYQKAMRAHGDPRFARWLCERYPYGGAGLETAWRQWQKEGRDE